MKRTLARAATVSLVALSLSIPATATALQDDAGAARRGRPERIRALDAGTNRFQPGRITVSRGTRVTFVNAGSLAHTTTSESGLWDERLSPGDSFARRFRRAGTFRFSCTIHPEMRGTIRVR
ncbi:MAG: cupredoxin domain-containing protein [Actinomycetota bacterium]